MFSLKPEEVVSYFADEAARVQDEVLRISSLLTERVPGSSRPRYVDRAGNFVQKIEQSADEVFMQKVAAAFEAMNLGWSAKIVSCHDICGKYWSFVLTHSSFAAFSDRQSEDFEIPD